MDPGRLGSRIARSLVRLLARPERRAQTADPPGIPAPVVGYPGDYTEAVDIRYSPKPDGRPDPGEVVWGWIPYEDDHSRGKDRPALVIGRDGTWLLVLMLTSRDKDRDGGVDKRHEVWVDIGSGQWDRQQRPSDVRVDRIVRLAEHAVRREGAILDRQRFDAVAAAVRAHRGM